MINAYLSIISIRDRDEFTTLKSVYKLRDTTTLRKHSQQRNEALLKKVSEDELLGNASDNELCLMVCCGRAKSCGQDI